MTTLRGILLLSFLLAGGCSGRGSGAPGAPEPTTTVRVENGNFHEMTIYLLRDSQRIRLGSVPGLSTRVLRIPPQMIFGITSVRFLADPLGSRETPISSDIRVAPGEQVELHIMP